MNQRSTFGKRAAAVTAALGLAAGSAQAWTVTKAESNQPYTVSAADLLQRNTVQVETNGLILFNEGNPNTVESLTDGTTGPGNREYCIAITGGSITYTLDTTKSPAGYFITGLDTVSGWQDNGRVNQNYAVSFRKAGSATFETVITNSYSSGLKELRVRMTDLNLTGIDAVRFTFLAQQNGGVGYKEFDLFGMACATPVSVAGESGSAAYPVSATDLLQTALGGTNDALTYYSESGFTNALSPALADGSFGSADRVTGTCGISGGTMTYTLDLTNHPAGYTIASLDTYTGWGDIGRDNQNYWVSFRKVGSSAFDDAVAVTYTGTVKLTHVNIANLDLTRVEAVRFTFLSQENGGVGYKELDVAGAAPAYAGVTRRDSGSQIIASNDTANVLVTEGTGTPGAITLGAATTAISTLTQGATDGPATIDPAGQALALSGLFLRPDAGGLEIGTGSNNGTLKGTKPSLVLCNLSTNDLVVRAFITNSASGATLLKTGSGALTLYGASACTGGTEVAAGTLRLAGSSASLGSGPVNVSGATLQLDGGTVSPATGNGFKLAFANGALNQTAGTLSYGGYLQAQNETLALSGGTSYVGQDALLGWGGTNTAATLSGSHTANWRVTRFSSGTVSLLLQSGGKLYTDRLYASAGAAGSVFFDGGVLGVSSINPGLNAGDWLGVASGSLALCVRNGGAVIDTSNGSVTIRRPFLRDGASAGGLTKIGANTLSLMITNAGTFCTYAGDTAVLGGTLKLGPMSAPLPTGTRLTIAKDAVLDLNSASQAVGEMNGEGRVINFSSTNSLFTVGGNNTSTNFDGKIEGAVCLVKTGSGTLTLTGANAYSNVTRIAGGTLRLSPLPVAIVNAGFELPAMTTGEFWGYLTSDGVTGGWTMGGNMGKDTGSGIARNGYPTNAPWVTTSPQGVQIAYLQGAGAFCFQTVTVQRAATYQLSFSAANRPRYTADNLDVLIDGICVAAWTNSAFASSGVFNSFATNIALTAGAHELKFQGTSPGGDTTTAIDDIRLVSAGLSAYGNLPTNAAIEIAAGATLDLAGTRQPISDLSGNGTVSNGMLDVQGVIAPGGTNAVGALTLAAAANLTGTLLVDAAKDGSCDVLQVSGGLELSGLTLQVQDPEQLEANAYLIATCAPGGLTGRFAATNLGARRAVCYDNANGRVLLIYSGTLISIH